MMSFINRVLMAAVLAAGLWSPTAQAQDKTLRIGFQKYGTLVILKERGALEKRLKSQGYTVTWTEFPGGPQLLEALNVGAIDFGTTGEAPPIFAQAAGAPPALRRPRAARPQGGGADRAQGQQDRHRRRPQGQAGGAEQGLQRPLPAGPRP